MKRRKSSHSSSVQKTCFGARGVFRCNSRLAQTTNLPDPETHAGHQHSAKHPKYRPRPSLERSRPQTDHMASVDHTEPSNQGIPQASCRAKDDEETIARHTQRTRREHKRREGNGRGENGGKKHRQGGMMFHPTHHQLKNASGNMSLESRF